MGEDSLFQKMKQIFQEDGKEQKTHKEEAAELIRNILRYMEKDANDIMTHRRDIIAVDGEETLEGALRFMLAENYSRFPIYEEDIDTIIGTVHLRDAMTCYFNESLQSRQLKELTDYIRPVLFIPGTKSIDKLFKQMQAEKNHIAIVLDEYGQTSGLVAMEDILEEIVGNIMDEYDEEEELIVKNEDGSYIANGFVDLEDLEEIIPLTFDKEEYETLNGFLVDQLDKIPSENEHCVVEYEGFRFTVLSVDNNAIQSVSIEKTGKE